MAVRPDVIVYPPNTCWWERDPYYKRLTYVFVEGPIYADKKTHAITALGSGIFIALQPASIGGKAGAMFKFSSQKFKVDGLNSFAGRLTISDCLAGGRVLNVLAAGDGTLDFFVGTHRVTPIPKESIHFEMTVQKVQPNSIAVPHSGSIGH